MVEIRPLDTTAFGGHSGTARFKGNLCTIFYNRNLKNLPLSERSPSDLPQANSTEGSKATTTIVAGCGNKPQSYLALGTTGNPVTRNPQKPAPLHLQCCGLPLLKFPKKPPLYTLNDKLLPINDKNISKNYSLLP